MKIIASIYYNNSIHTIKTYTLGTKIENVNEDVKQFILSQTPKIDYDNLIIQWSDLIKYQQNYPETTLRCLLRDHQKMKIGYGGYIRFNLLYEHIEIYDNLLLSESPNNKLNKCFLNVMPYLTYQDNFNLSLSSKRFYKFVFIYNFKEKRFLIKNQLDTNSITQSTNESLKLPFSSYQDNKYFLLGSFIGEHSSYYLLQSLSSYNVDIIKVDNIDSTKQEVIFSDEWTNYFINHNIIYQFKYENKKPSINKINQNEKDYEIKFVTIKSSNNPCILGDFSIEQFYAYQPFKSFILTTNKILYEIKNKKSKLLLLFDFSLQYKKFLAFSNHCKIRQYNTFVKFIGEYMFISQRKFHIVNILNKRTMNEFPTIKGVDLVTSLNREYFFVRNHNSCFLISKKNFEIEKQFVRGHTNLCVNELNIIDPVLNVLSSAILKKNEKNDILKKEDLLVKFNESFFCYNWYNTNRFLYVKLISTTNKEKVIQLSMEKYVKKITKNVDIKTKIKLIQNIKPTVLINRYSGLVVAVNEYYWFYKQCNIMNNFCLKKIKCICVKTNLTFSFHNYIFTKDKFLIWSENSYKILYFELNEDSEMKMLDLEELEENNDLFTLNDPIFLFQQNNNIYLVTSYSDYFSFFVNQISFSTSGIILEKAKQNEKNKFLLSLEGYSIDQKKEKIIYINIISENNIIIFTSTSIYIDKYDPISKGYFTHHAIKHVINSEFYIRKISTSEGKYLAYCEDVVLYYNLEKYISNK